jgi:hypothetical protein
MPAFFEIFWVTAVISYNSKPWEQLKISEVLEFFGIKFAMRIDESATTRRAGGMRMAPGRGRGHLCWWSLIVKKNFLLSVLSDLSGLMTT